MRLKFILMCLMVPMALLAQPFTSSETPSQIELSSGYYSVSVKKDNLGIAIKHGNRVIAETSDSAFVFESKGMHYMAEKIVSWKMQGKTLFIQAATSQKQITSELVCVFEKDQVDISWKLPENLLANNISVSFQIKPGKHWYGGPVVAGHQWPLETAQIRFDPMLAHSNQATPFWITASGVGYFMPTYEEMSFSLNDKNNGRFELQLKNTRSIQLKLFVGDNITETYRVFAKSIGLPKTVPPKGFFDRALFNSWIEHLKEVDQAKVIDYAKKIRSNGFPCEVLMVDAGWSPIHGNYDFDSKKFPDPKAMIDELHSMGFKLILWISPYVRKGSPNFEILDRSKYLIMDETGSQSGPIKWWGGTDYEIDMSNPKAFEWFLEVLRKLQQKYGVDGFKQDGGDARYIPFGYKTFAGATPNLSTDYWAKLGDYFEYNEYRVSWLMQSSGLVQRLRDKHNNWSNDTGLGSLIPHGLTNSLIGYPYFCPDMIGGGDSKDFRDQSKKVMGTELFVRWTQASALMPMMQFSYAPWNLDEKSLAICRKYAQLHHDLGDYFYELALEAAKTGDPIARPLFYNYPADEKSYLISDEFMVGDKLLVAPVLTQGAVSRNIYLPPGTWKDFWSDKLIKGGIVLKDFSAPIDVLPIFIKIND